jgi:tetrapyrrole methylase family protein / MazG family protein
MTVLPRIDRFLSSLNLGELSSIYITAASALYKLHLPPFPPDVNAIITGIDSKEKALAIKDILSAVYPSDHQIKVLVDVGQEQPKARIIPLKELSEQANENPNIAVLIPPLSQGTAFESFQEIVAHLRAPDGCPWDREQTHQTLRKHLIEESYETLDAIDSGDPDKMREEFGDLLLQIVLNAQIAQESREFSMGDIVHGIHDKIVRRHPHVFGDVVISGVGNVLQNWEKIKAEERESRGDNGKGLLDGLPVSLPALVQAQEMQSRAARVGFDWPEIDGVLDKVREEIEEIRETSNKAELADELGDLLFALVNLARWKGIDAESTLRDANRKFKKRFAFVENGAKGLGRNLSDLSLEEMEVFWQSAKDLET